MKWRKPVPTTNPDVFAKGHDSDLHNTYLDEMLVFDQEMITYQSKLDTLTEVYSLELKAWSNNPENQWTSVSPYLLMLTVIFPPRV